ncbi:MAG: glycosyltransferase family 39 protein [bacterium]|nr:glycosyltransferase family 39 protein [bacterium]
MKELNWKKTGLIVSVIAIGLALRLYFMFHMPFTNDEGAYLYDAKTILRGELPGGDVVTKSPVAILLFTVFTFISNGSLFSARVTSLIFGLATLLPLLIIVRYGLEKNLIMASTIWFTFSAPVVLTGLGHTEAIAGFFAATTIALAIWAVRKERLGWWIVLSGISFALAVGSRKINLVLLVPLVLLVLQKRKNIISIRKFFLLFGFGSVLVLLLLGILILKLYGYSGLGELFGSGYAHIIGSRIAGDSSVNIWGITILDTIKILGRIATAHVVIVLLAVAGIILKLTNFKNWKFGNLLLMGVSWIVALTALYATWPTFLPDYVADFLVPITVLGVWVISKIWKQNILLVKVLVVLCFVVLNVLSYVSVFTAPWTGMFTADASETMALEMKNLIPSDQSVLTAATVVPYLSGHKTLFNISHPLWYRYDFIAEDEKNLFLPPWEKVSSAIQDGEVRWLLMEHLTDYAYFRNADQLINLLNQDWELVAVVPNNTGFRSNMLKLYRRK